MAKVIIVAMLGFAIGAMTGSATTTNTEELEIAALYTACASMQSLVARLDPEDVRQTGLTEKAIMNTVESRLRAARLYASIAKQEQGRSQYLYINVNIFDSAFSIAVDLNRHLENLGYGLSGFATVWHTGLVGTHGRDGQYILGSISEILDQFIASYLRVNEADCSR